MFLTNFIITKCECNSLVVVQWTIKFGESWSEFNGTNEFTPNSMKALLCKDTFYYNVYRMSTMGRVILTRVPIPQMIS